MFMRRWPGTVDDPKLSSPLYLEGQGHSMTFQQNRVWPITLWIEVEIYNFSQEWSPYWDNLTHATFGLLPWRPRSRHDFAAKSCLAQNLFEGGFYNYFWQTTSLCPIPIRGALPGSDRLLLWNLVRMFILSICRPTLNMGHVGSKTRSPGQIFGNSCLHSRGQISNPILMKLDQNVCLSNFWPSSKICHVWSKSRSPGQILVNSCLHILEARFATRFW